MATTSSIKTTVSTTLGTITTAAQAVGAIFDTVSGGVQMMNRAVQTASEKQITGTDYEMADFEQNLLNNVAVERTRQNREINRFLDEDPANRTEFTAVFENIQNAVAARREARSKSR